MTKAELLVLIAECTDWNERVDASELADSILDRLASSSTASVSASKCKSHGLLSCAECDPARVSEPDNDWYNPNREAYQACFVSPDNSQAVAQWKCNACISTFTKYESLGESGKPNCPKGVALSEHRINELETTLSLADERFVNAITRLKELESQAVALSAEQERYKVALEAIVANDPFKQSSAGAIARAALAATQAPIYQVIDETVDAWNDTDWMAYQSSECEKRIVYAAPALAATQAPTIIYAYEWDHSPGVVRRSFDAAPYNGRLPDRTLRLCAAPESSVASKEA